MCQQDNRDQGLGSDVIPQQLTMNQVGLEAQKLANVLKPMVALIVKEIRPLDDDISMNAAYKTYGRLWIEGHRREGNLQERRRGRRIYLSRAQIELLRTAELNTPQLVFRADKSTGYVTTRDEATGKLIIKKDRIKKNAKR